MTWRYLRTCAKWAFAFAVVLAVSNPSKGTHHRYGVALLYPVLFSTVPAALLWYADRRRFRPGACAGCGYDRRGISTDAKRPECGRLPA